MVVVQRALPRRPHCPALASHSTTCYPLLARFREVLVGLPFGFGVYVCMCVEEERSVGAAYGAVPGLASTATIDPKLARINQHPSPGRPLALYHLAATRFSHDWYMQLIKIVGRMQ